MPSKSETARVNGAKSKGPTTEAGKAKSARNSLRHGLTAQSVVLPGEEFDDYDKTRDAYVEQFQPANQMEVDLVEAMAAARVRLRRVIRIETGMFANKQFEVDDHRGYKRLKDEDQILAYVFEPCLPSISLLSRYENSLNRAFDRALKQLQLLQKARLARPPQKLQNEPKPDPKPLAAATETPDATSELASGV